MSALHGLVVAVCWCWLCFLPWPFLSERSIAEASPLAPHHFKIALDDDDDTALFVVGNTLFAVYHELGHALIDLLDLPVVGREEDAADGFAAVMMIPPEPDTIRDELIIAVADGWRLQSELMASGGDQFPLWAEHALDEQRFFAVVCWLVGSDQEGFFEFADEAGMPLERIETCADDFERMKASWHDLLDGYEDGAASSGDSEEGRMTVTFDKPKPEDAEAFTWTNRGDVVARSIRELDRNIRLPDDILIRFQSCDEANAYWHGERGEVLICYSLVGDFLSMLDG